MASLAAPALALIPGLNNTGAVWDGVVASLGGAAQCHVLECPALETVEAVADDLLAQLPERFFLAGFSFGGYVALAMLERAPQRVAGLAMVNTCATADNEVQRAARQKAIETAQSGGHEAMVAAQAALVFHPDSLVNVALMQTRARMVKAYGAHRMIAHARACLARPDRTAIVAAARCPVLVVAADGDGVIPTASQKAFAQSLPNAAYSEIGAAGHMLPLERPAALADVLGSWLTRAALDTKLSRSGLHALEETSK